MTRFYSEALSQHDRNSFACGNERIDGYFRTAVSQDVKRKYAACYVLVERSTGRLAGFYTLSATTIPLTAVPADIARKLPRYPTIPAVLVGWLGRDMAFRGENIGAMLLHDAILRVSAAPIGAYAIVADAIDDGAEAFYRRHQFVAYASAKTRLFLPLATALRSLPAS